MLLALFFNLVKGYIAGNNVDLGRLLDMVYFGILAAGTVVFAISLLEINKKMS